MRLSIRYKFLTVLGLLLLIAIGFYTGLATLIFREDKTALLYDINHSIAVNTAAQLRASLEQLGDRLRLFTLAEVMGTQSNVHLPHSYLEDNHVLGLALFRKEAGNYRSIAIDDDIPSLKLSQEALLQRFAYLGRSRADFWSETQDGTERFYLAQSIPITIAQQMTEFMAVAEVDGKPFFETLQAANLFTAFLAKPDGSVLIHCEKAHILPSISISEHALLKEFHNKGQASSGLLQFEDGGKRWFGAFAPVGVGNLVFLSQASASEVDNASRILMHRSLLFGLIVLTLTFIASILFSKRLSRNIQALRKGTQQIEQGDLSTEIRIQSHDEVQDLAASFNAMTRALRISREKIEQYNRELEAKVALRTQQLHETNAAIKEVQEKLLKATQLAAIGEVAGRAAHEVLNPLTAILNRLERSQGVLKVPGTSTALPGQLADIISAWEDDFRKGGLDHLTRALAAPSSIHANQTLIEEDLENLKKLAAFWQDQSSVVTTDLEFVHEQAQRIHRIIDRMRELGRSSVKSDIHLHEAISEAIMTMTDFLSKHNIQIEEAKAAADDFANLNKDEFIQILTNLLRNSFHAIEVKNQTAKSNEPGKITVCTSAEGNLLSVDVIDNGIGIPPDKQHLLFEQGFTTKGPQEGTGLGLAICRRYARAFGGEVNLLFSEPQGRGTCFRVSVPLLRTVRPEGEEPRALFIRPQREDLLK